MLGFLVNRPYNIVEKQKRIQADTRPIYHRYPTSRLFIRIYGVLWTAGMGGTVYAIYSLIKGKSKEA